jgi:hypothetical protein
MDISQFDERDEEDFLYFTFINTNYQHQNFFQRLRWHPRVKNLDNAVNCVDVVSLKYPKVIQLYSVLNKFIDDKRKVVNFHDWNFEKLNPDKQVALWGESELFTSSEGLLFSIEVHNYKNKIYLESVNFGFRYMNDYSTKFKEADFGSKKKEYIKDVLKYIFRNREHPFYKNELSISQQEATILISYIDLIIDAFRDENGVYFLKEEYIDTLPNDIWFPEDK